VYYVPPVCCTSRGTTWNPGIPTQRAPLHRSMERRRPEETLWCCPLHPRRLPSSGRVFHGYQESKIRKSPHHPARTAICMGQEKLSIRWASRSPKDKLPPHTILAFRLRAMHTEQCTDQDPRPLESSINVINCRTGSTGRWNGRDKYLALSYVWGHPDRTGTDDGSYPKLVSDAIIFTLAVGIKYLWVDKYCIDQKDPDDVSRQIAQMDRIYENATATIVAASCSISDGGLPGVSTALRETQPWSISSDGTLLVSSMVSTMRIFADSHWSARGWTYQEAVIPRRCLVFTKQQVHFICKTMSTFESANHSLAPMKDGRYIRNTSTSLGADLFQPGSLDPEEGRTFRAHLSAFTARNLTNEEDILDAFRGILNRQIWWSLWGIPFPTDNWWRVRSREPSPARSQPWWSLGDIPFPTRNRRKALRNPSPMRIDDSSVDA
jgi:hypothetical protein